MRKKWLCWVKASTVHRGLQPATYPGARPKATVGLCAEKPVTEEYRDNNYDSTES